jgi:nitronate monooxygenase
VADGRGLAAALVLGADGVVMGSRFWASEEALVHPNLQKAAVAASGDDTLRGRTIDIARGLDVWPARYNLRTMRSQTTDLWHDKDAELRAVADVEGKRYAEAAAIGNAEIVSPIVGEAVGLIHEVAPASKIVQDIVAEAEGILTKRAAAWVSG